MSKTPFTDAMMGLLGSANKDTPREVVLQNLHRCHNPQCMIRQAYARDGFIKACAIRSIAKTLTEDKEYMLTGGNGNGNWVTVDDEGVRYSGILAARKDVQTSDSEPASFYITEAEMEAIRLSLPADDEHEAGHGEGQTILTMAQAYEELVTKHHNAPRFLSGEVLRLRPGFYTTKLDHLEEWPVVAVNSLAKPEVDATGEWVTTTIMIRDPRDGEIMFQRVNGNRYRLAPVEDQFTEEAKIKAAQLKGE